MKLSFLPSNLNNVSGLGAGLLLIHFACSH